MSLADLSEIWKPRTYRKWRNWRKKKYRLARIMMWNPTEGEAQAWAILQEINRYTTHFFRRQQLVCGYILDFYCHTLRIGIEIDGSIHQTYEQIKSDNWRTHNLANEGIKILRFSNKEVLSKPLKVMDVILATIKERLTP